MNSQNVFPFSLIHLYSLHYRLKQLIGHLREDAAAIDPDTLISNLEYVADVVSWMASKTE